MDDPARAAVRMRAALAVVAALAITLIAAPAASADFGLTDFSVAFQDPAGHPVTQAGGHPDMVTALGFKTAPSPVSGNQIPDEQVRNVKVDLPAGFYGNPNAAARCTYAELFAQSGNCPAGAQVGILQLKLDLAPLVFPFPVYNMETGHDETAVIAGLVYGVLVKIEVSPRADGDGGLTATIANINQTVTIYRTQLTLWGVPADPAHDALRFSGPFMVGASAGVPRKPFLSMPARCDAPLTTTVHTNSWQHSDRWVTELSTAPAPTGCDKLAFDGQITARPSTTARDTPAGYDVDLTIPQDDSWSGLSTPQLKKAVVTLPEGVAISPASANGLDACSDKQLGRGTDAEPTCPDSSKIGTVRIDTPLLTNALEGDIILGEPKPGQLFRLFLVVRGSGILLKLPGVVEPDPKTGQLTTVFDDNPQLPFTNLHLHFKGGARAPLVNPQTCGTKMTTATLVPWAGPTATPTDSFDVTDCTGGFAPSFEAGTVNPAAGAFGAFTMTIRRSDGDQEISTISVNLPPGLLGILSGIPQCPEAQAAAGTCDASTQVGTTTVESGSGDQPLPLTGKVFLAGPYKGAPFSLSIVVNAIAGPFDLGTVVVRAPINIDAAAGKVSVPADPLPTILQGVPLRLRTINVTLDRPGFMFNATNCTPMSVGATLTSVNGTTVTPSSRYQALGCADLPLKPKFSMRLSGRYNMKKLGHPGVVANLSQTPGQAGLKSVRVALPAGLSVDLRNLGSICKAVDAAARKCADAAIVGKASAKTPALPGRLSGPVYLVEGVSKDPVTGKVTTGLPKLWLKLEGGGVPLDLWANSSIVGGRVVTTFPTIPDAPISSFRLQINGGAKGILQTGRDLCRASRTSKVKFDGQNGRVVSRTIRVGGDCPRRSHKKK